VPKADEGVVTDVNEVMTVDPRFTREIHRPPHPIPLPRGGGEGTEPCDTTNLNLTLNNRYDGFAPLNSLRSKRGMNSVQCELLLGSS
jgi:hypothetical protein